MTIRLATFLAKSALEMPLAKPLRRLNDSEVPAMNRNKGKIKS